MAAAAAAAAAAAVPDKIAQQHFLSVTKEGRDLQAASDSARETRVLLYFSRDSPHISCLLPILSWRWQQCGDGNLPYLHLRLVMPLHGL